eukprot:5462322-Pyramimonas_sp.AAC.1
MIAKSGALSSGSYGLSIIGFATKQLELLRNAVGMGLFGPARGLSRTMQFWLSPSPGADPAYVANALPLAAWGQALWQEWAPGGQMEFAFNALSQRGEEFTWSEVKGPTGA